MRDKRQIERKERKGQREREKTNKKKWVTTTQSLTSTSNTLLQLRDDIDGLVKHRQFGLSFIALEVYLTHSA